jgi:hypothetical protein
MAFSTDNSSQEQLGSAKKSTLVGASAQSVGFTGPMFSTARSPYAVQR